MPFITANFCKYFKPKLVCPSSNPSKTKLNIYEEKTICKLKPSREVMQFSSLKKY